MQQQRRRTQLSFRQVYSFLGWPALAWLLLFILGPLFYLLMLSFLTKGTYGQIEWKFQSANFIRSFEWIYLDILQRSLVLASLTTLFCLMLSLPMAWAISAEEPKRRNLWFSILVVPFLMNLISRVYALRAITSYDGPLAFICKFIWGESFDVMALTQNSFLVMYGMVATYLPFMLFPVYIAFEKFDYSQIEAAQDLGASEWRTFFKIVLPQLRPALASGITMVFVPSLGEFVIPDLLGGAKMMLAGNIVTEQFLKSRDWPFGAALAIEMIVFMSLLTLVLAWWGRQDESKSR